MSIELKVSSLAISAKQHSQNLDNYYLHGRTVQNFTEPVEKNGKTTMADLQVYGVVDSGVMSDNTIAFNETARNIQNAFMQIVSELHEDLEQEGKIDKDIIWNAVKAANEQAIAINSQSSYGNRKVVSSFALLFMKGNKGMAVHLGDSRIYVIRDGRLLQITEDHTEFASLIQHNIITPEQMDIHKKSAKLSYYLGTDKLREAREVAFSKYFIFYPGDVFLLVTDGVTDVVRMKVLDETAKAYRGGDVFEMGQELIKKASEGGDDDATIIVLRTDECEGSAPERTAPKKETSRVQAVVKPFAQAQKAEKAEAAETAETAEAAEPAETSKKPFGELIEKTQNILHQERSEEPAEDNKLGMFDRLKATGAANAQKDTDDTKVFAPSKSQPEKQDDYDYEDDYNDEAEEDNYGLLETIRMSPARYGIILALVIFFFVALVFILKSCKQEGEESIVLESRGSVVTSIEDSEEESSEASQPDESSQAGESKVDESKLDESKVDESKVDESKVDESKIDESKVDESKADESKTNESKAVEVITVTAKKGDTYWTYCNKYYGSNYTSKAYTDALKKYNGNKGVMEGVRYKIPPLEELGVN